MVTLARGMRVTCSSWEAYQDDPIFGRSSHCVIAMNCHPLFLSPPPPELLNPIVRKEPTWFLLQSSLSQWKYQNAHTSAIDSFLPSYHRWRKRAPSNPLIPLISKGKHYPFLASLLEFPAAHLIWMTAPWVFTPQKSEQEHSDIKFVL